MAAAEAIVPKTRARRSAGFGQRVIAAIKYSLRGRITLAAGVLLCLSLAAVSVQSLTILRDEIRRTTIEHDRAFLTSLTRHLTADLIETRQDLSDFSAVFPRAFLSDPAAASAFLKSRVGLARIFDGGLRLYAPSGQTIASTSGAAQRPQSAAERNAFQAAMKSGQPQISEPFVRDGARSKPEVAFFAAIRTAGPPSGAVEGILNLDGYNSVSSLPRARLGKGGYIFLADRHGRIIADPDPQRVLSQVSLPGADSATARLSAGQIIAGETRSPEGQPLLTSVQQLPLTGWLLGINLPNEEVYAPVRPMERYILIGAAISFALLLLAMAWTMRLLIKPLERITEQVRAISKSGQTGGQRIQLRGGPRELTTLADDFNEMLTSLERHREALVRRERRFRSLIEDSSDIVAVIDRDGTLTFISPSASALGYTIEEVNRRSVDDYLHPDDTAASDAALRHVLEDATKSEMFDCRVRRKDGSFRHYEVIIRNRLSDPDVRGIILSGRDVSDRRAAEEAVRLEEQRLRVALHCANVVAFNQDRNLRYTWCANTQFFPDREDVIGKTDADLFQAEYASHLEQVKGRVIATGRGERTEAIIPRENGDHTIIVALEPLREANGEISGIVGAAMDVTDQRKTEEMLRTAQRMESLGNLTGGIAHDFNNFLGIILANLESIRAAVPETGKVQRLIANALTAANHGARLTGNLLAFARQQPLRPEPLDMAIALDTFAEMFRPAAGKGIKMEIDIAPDVWTCMADADQLQNMLLNLAMNARDAMTAEGALTIRARNVTSPYDETGEASHIRNGDFVHLSVTDTGPGMAAEIAARAFEPFFTTKAAGHGTGLGLSMVYGFARQSGGHATIASEIGAGTTVSVYLPRALAHPSISPVDYGAGVAP